MHHSLQVPEIIDLILSQLPSRLVGPEQSAARFAALAALARTCTTFYDPALNRLWETQSSLDNLLRCMPSDLFEDGDTGRLRRPVVPTDWDRAVTYARRVKTFLSPRDFSMFPLFSNCLSGDWLFPNLTHLHWAADDSYFHHIGLLLSPRLTRITIIMPPSPLAQFSILPTLPYKCASLKNVSINWHHRSDQHFPDPVATFGPSLSVLRRRTTANENPRRLPRSFNSLQCFPLASLVPSSHSRLSYLHLDLSGLEGTPVTAGTSRKLFCFPNLTNLHLESNFGFDLDDAAILEMARAWRHLETLELPEQVASPSSRLTPECLRILAQHSPRLRTLHLTFDASSVVPAPGSGTQDPVSQLLLASLDVAHSAIIAPLSVARFISAIFPNLRRITTAREYYDDDDDDVLENHAETVAFHARWKEVQAQIPVLVEIREEGKLWGRQK
ncbi:hypothetical protein C8R43DRAFT_587340 [Mycena crocata]|nr:hypothetical protein C8R43DRAFT_587340 [Mycena crocata]